MSDDNSHEDGKRDKKRNRNTAPSFDYHPPGMGGGVPQQSRRAILQSSVGEIDAYRIEKATHQKNVQFSEREGVERGQVQERAERLEQLRSPAQQAREDVAATRKALYSAMSEPDHDHEQITALQEQLKDDKKRDVEATKASIEPTKDLIRGQEHKLADLDAKHSEQDAELVDHLDEVRNAQRVPPSESEKDYVGSHSPDQIEQAGIDQRTALFEKQHLEKARAKFAHEEKINSLEKDKQETISQIQVDGRSVHDVVVQEHQSKNALSQGFDENSGALEDKHSEVQIEIESEIESTEAEYEYEVVMEENTYDQGEVEMETTHSYETSYFESSYQESYEIGSMEGSYMDDFEGPSHDNSNSSEGNEL